MAIYEFSADGIHKVHETTFGTAGLQERHDLQRLLRSNIQVVSPDTLVIAEEFGDWEDSKRRIDILGIDKDANLVVIELKRTQDGGHMELQAIRYAAMVSTMTFEQTVEVYRRYLQKVGREREDPMTSILEFLEWDTPDDDQFAQDVRIVLASGEFSKELTSAVMWLTTHDLDIRCVRLKPYDLDGRVLVDVQQIIPLPEAGDYQIQLKEKARRERKARVGGPDFTRFDVSIAEEKLPAMWKRNAIFAICKHLCENGVNPEDIARLFEWRTDRVWYCVDRDVGAEQFIELASRKAESGGSAFRRQRWFCGEDELVHANGKTYAFSNQWGGDKWRKAMDKLRDAYPEFEIGYAPIA